MPAASTSTGSKRWVSANEAFVDDPPETQEDPRIYRSLSTLWPEWTARASCLGDNEELFFGSSSPQTRPAYTLTAINRAKEKCFTCPVFESCLRQALRNREQFGVWAATTMKERSIIFRMLAEGRTTEEEVVAALMFARRKVSA